MDLNDGLFRAVKRTAVQEVTTFKAVVEGALRRDLAAPAAKGNYRLKWRTEEGRLLPGIDINGRDFLPDFMDGLR